MSEANQVVYHGDACVVQLTDANRYDTMITDPPYSVHVHNNATSQSRGRGTRKRDLGFVAISERVRQSVAGWAAHVKRWSVVYSDVEDSHLITERINSFGIEYVRTMAWIRWSMPQLSGDRPPQGFEHILVFHPRGRKHWNGPGNLTHLDHTCLRGESKHKTEKPLDQALDLVSFFTDVGETVVDPFAGSGTIGVACALLGRSYVGYELDEGWAAKANARLLGDVRDSARAERWLASTSEPVSALPEGPSRVRAEKRALDKANVRNGVYLPEGSPLRKDLALRAA